MKPIEKNVIVTDSTGVRIGLTYPKRARGLVKKGRAEYVSADCIKLLGGTRPPPVKDTEDFKMSNIIDFNAAEFKFDTSVQPTEWNSVNAGSRMFLTDFKGENVQVFEIGDWQWTWSQIKCTKQLEPNTDYLFRFAVSGGVNDTGNGVSHFIVMHDKDWDDRLEYPLERSRFKPLISKRGSEGWLRVYEIPFNSGESGEVTLIFNAQHFVETIMPAYENEAYAELEDVTYNQLWQEIQDRENSERICGGGSVNLSGAVISNGALAEKLAGLAAMGIHLNLSGAVIGGDEDDECGEDDDDEWKYDRKAEEVDSKAEEYDRKAEEAELRWKQLNGIKDAAIEQAYLQVKAQYESLPDGSLEKGAVKLAIDGLARSMGLVGENAE